jgi:hypothetical protein
MNAKPTAAGPPRSRGKRKQPSPKPASPSKRKAAFDTWKVTGAGGRLESNKVLTAADFQAIAGKSRLEPMRARKTGLIAARRATRARKVETRWNGKETTNRAKAGDWIVTSLSPARKVLRDADGHKNTYVVPAGRFLELYAPLRGKEIARLGKVYRPKGVVTALHFRGGFDILAPWGERQTAPAGYLILNGADVYGNNAETFEATYEALV